MIWCGDIQDTKLIAFNRDIQSKPTQEAPNYFDTQKVASQSRSGLNNKTDEGAKSRLNVQNAVGLEGRRKGE